MDIQCLDFGEEYEKCKGLKSDDFHVIAIVVTREMILDINCLVYLEIVHSLFKKKKVYVITAVYEMKQSELPNRLQWIKDTQVTIIEQCKDQYLFCYRCACANPRYLYNINSNNA